MAVIAEIHYPFLSFVSTWNLAVQEHSCGEEMGRPGAHFCSFCTVSGYHMACHVLGVLLYNPGRDCSLEFRFKAGKGQKEERMVLVTESFHS